jgi:hypothetical protein
MARHRYVRLCTHPGALLGARTRVCAWVRTCPHRRFPPGDSSDFCQKSPKKSSRGRPKKARVVASKKARVVGRPRFAWSRPQRFAWSRPPSLQNQKPKTAPSVLPQTGLTGGHASTVWSAVFGAGAVARFISKLLATGPAPFYSTRSVARSRIPESRCAACVNACVDAPPNFPARSRIASMTSGTDWHTVARLSP